VLTLNKIRMLWVCRKC